MNKVKDEHSPSMIEVMGDKSSRFVAKQLGTRLFRTCYSMTDNPNVCVQVDMEAKSKSEAREKSNSEIKNWLPLLTLRSCERLD